MTRRWILAALALGFYIAGFPATAHAQTRVPLVGILTIAAGRDEPVIKTLLQGLRDLGYVEGQTVRFEFRTADNHADRLPALAAELVSAKPDVIVVSSLVAAKSVNAANPDVPVVFFLGADPVAFGLAKSHAHPGGNVTGLSIMTTELTAKLLQLLRDAIPRLSRVAFLWNPDSPRSALQKALFEELKQAAVALSIELVILEAGTLEELDKAFAAARAARVQALYVNDSPLFYVRRETLAQLAIRAKLPSIFRTRAFVEAGGLFSYGPNWMEHARRAPVYVDRILKGAKPADLPIEQPTKVELVVNLKTAKALGITVPESILSRADEVIR